MAIPAAAIWVILMLEDYHISKYKFSCWHLSLFLADLRNPITYLFYSIFLKCLNIYVFNATFHISAVTPELTVDKDRKVLRQALGYSRELTCEAKGNPVPTTVMWYRDGVALDNTNKLVSSYLL